MNNKSKIIALFIIFALLGGFFGAVGGFLFSYKKSPFLSESRNNSVSGFDFEEIFGNIGEEFLGVDFESVIGFGYENLIVSAVENSNPSVVSIIVSKDVPVIERYFANPFDNLPPEFRDFFEGFEFEFEVPKQENGTEKREIGGGTGFIVSSEGMIITNRHVVYDESAEYTVFLNDGRKYSAEILDRDPINDLSIIKIEENDLPVLKLGDSNNLKIGQTAIAIGNTLSEFKNTVSVGVVSGLRRTIIANDIFNRSSEKLENIIQTDAAINPGNSGRPLLNLKGEVIGVNTAMAQSAQNVGFAIPINLVKRAIDSYETFGEIIHPYLGIRYISINEEIKEKNNLSVDYGILLKMGDNGDPAIMKDSPAEKSGLKDNDIILEINEKRIDSNNSLTSLIQEYKVGDLVKLKVLRDNIQIEVEIEFGKRPDDL
jgi:S1-C subfamily serine protease